MELGVSNAMSLTWIGNINTKPSVKQPERCWRTKKGGDQYLQATLKPPIFNEQAFINDADMRTSGRKKRMPNIKQGKQYKLWRNVEKRGNKGGAWSAGGIKHRLQKGV